MIGCKPFTDKEVFDVLKILKTPRDKCLFYLGVKTGFRISELLSIRIQDLLEHDNTLKGSVTVLKSKMKGKIATRSVALNTETIEALYEYLSTLPEDQVYLFESSRGRLSRYQASRIIKEAAYTLNLTGKIATHSMRKTFCSRVYSKSGKDLVKTQRAMGHTSPNSTVSYISFLDSEIDDLVKSI